MDFVSPDRQEEAFHECEKEKARARGRFAGRFSCRFYPYPMSTTPNRKEKTMSLRVVSMAVLSSIALTSMAFAACDTPVADRFVVNGDEVYDSKTNLTWQRC